MIQPDRNNELPDEFGNIWFRNRPLYDPSNMEQIDAVFDRFGKGALAAVDEEAGRVWVIGPDVESLAMGVEALDMPTDSFILYRKISDFGQL